MDSKKCDHRDRYCFVGRSLLGSMTAETTTSASIYYTERSILSPGAPFHQDRRQKGTVVRIVGRPD
jgi:hypothetical protein